MRQQKHGSASSSGSGGPRPPQDQHSTSFQYKANQLLVPSDQGSSDEDEEASKASKASILSSKASKASILSADPLKWIQSSHFSSTLDVGAIKETSTSTISHVKKAPLTTIAENWETEDFGEANKFQQPVLHAEPAPIRTLSSDSSSDSESDCRESDDRDNTARETVDVDDDESEDKETDECAATDSDSESNDGSSSSSCSSDSSSDNEPFQKIYSGRNLMVHRHESSKKSHGSFRKGGSRYSRSMKREREFYSSGHSYRTEDSSVLWNTSIASDIISFSNQKSAYSEADKNSRKHGGHGHSDQNVFHKTAESTFQQYRQENHSKQHRQDSIAKQHHHDNPTKQHRQEPNTKLLCQEASAKLLRQDAPAKLHRQDTPSKLHRQDTPAKLHRQESPAKLHRQDNPTKLHRQEATSKQHRQEGPAKLHRQDNPAKQHRQESPAFLGSRPPSQISNKKRLKSHRNYSNAPQGAFLYKNSNLKSEDSSVQVGPKSIWEPKHNKMDLYKSVFSRNKNEIAQSDKGYDLITHHTETVAKNKSYDFKWVDKRKTNYSSVDSSEKYRSLFSRKMKKGLKKKVREHIDNANLSDDSVILLPKKENSSEDAAETYSGDLEEQQTSTDVKTIKRIDLEKIYDIPSEAEEAIKMKTSLDRDVQSSRFKNAVENQLPDSSKLLESLWQDRNMRKNDSKFSKMRIQNSHNRSSTQDRSRVYIVDTPSSSPPYIANYNNSTNYDELSKSVCNLDCDDTDSNPPPILEPIIACCQLDSKGLRYHSHSNKESHRSKRRGRPKGSKNKKKVECASQTDHDASSMLQSAYPLPLPAPPRLIGIEDAPVKTNRGRPRKNPPMLVPETISKHSQVSYKNSSPSSMQIETHKNARKKRKKGKLSVLLIAAKHWKSKQKSERGYKNVQSQENTVYYASSPERQLSTVEEEIRKRDLKEIERKLFPSTFKKSMSHSKLHSKKKCRHRKLLNLKFKKHKTIIKSESEDGMKIDSSSYSQLCADVKSEASVPSPQESVIELKQEDTGPSMDVFKENTEASIDVFKENTVPSMDVFKEDTGHSLDVFKEIQPPTHSTESSEMELKTQQRNQVQQMLSALAATADPSDEVVKHKKEHVEIDEDKRDSNTKIRETSLKSDSVIKIFDAKSRSDMKVFDTKSQGDVKVFDTKYSTLEPEPFWKKKSVETVDEKSDRLAAIEYEKTPEGCGSRFMTKAYLKEIPPSIPAGSSQTLITPKTQQRNQVQQMLSALAATDDPVAKLPGRRKKELDRETVHRDASYETPGYESEDDDNLRKRDKKSKGWRSKHKNVIDPVFLGEVEHLIQDISACKLEMKLPADLWPDRPTNSVPSIFRRRKVPIGKRKKDLEKPIKRIKSRQQSKDGNESHNQSITPEANEQRLPLKKRHHHIEGDGQNKLSQQKTESTEGQGSTATIDLPLLKLLTTWDSKQTTPVKEDENAEKEKNMADFYFKGALEKNNRKLTAADTIGEKLRIQNLIRSKDISNNDRRINITETKIKSAFVNNIEECINKYTGSNKDASRQKSQTETGIKLQKNEPSQGKRFPKPFLVEEVHLKDLSASNFSQMQKQSTGKPNDYQKLSTAELQTNSFSQMQKQNTKRTQEYQKLPATELQGNSFSQIQKENSGKIQVLLDNQSVSSGRESSMSVSSSVSDTCSLSVSIDSADSSSEFSHNLVTPPLKTKPSIGRALRQDLHQYLLKPEDTSRQTKLRSQEMQQGFGHGLEKNKKVNPTGINFIVNKKAEKIHLPTTKPLPMEPIRRVDLGPSCLRPLPMDKDSIRNSSKENLMTRKVPQAIVAPFQRFPPQGEKSLGDQLMHMHRADVSSRVETNTSPSVDIHHQANSNRDESSPLVTSGVSDQVNTERSQVMQHPNPELLPTISNMSSPSTSKIKQNLTMDETNEISEKEKGVNLKVTSLQDSAIANTSCTVLRTEAPLLKQTPESMQPTTSISSPGTSKTRQNFKLDIQNQTKKEEKRKSDKISELEMDNLKPIDNELKKVVTDDSHQSNLPTIPTPVSSFQAKTKPNDEIARNNISLRSKDKKKESEQLETRARRTKSVSKVSSEKEELRPKNKPSGDKSGKDDYKKLSKLRKCQVDVAILNNAISNLISNRCDQTSNRYDQPTNRYDQPSTRCDLPSNRCDRPENATLDSSTTNSKEETVIEKSITTTNETKSINTVEKLNSGTGDSDLNPNLDKVPKISKGIEDIYEVDSPLNGDEGKSLLKEIKVSPNTEDTTDVVDSPSNLLGNKTDRKDDEIKKKELTNKTHSPPLNDENLKGLTNELELAAKNESRKFSTKEAVHQSSCESYSLQSENNLKKATFGANISLNEETDIESHQPLNQRKRKRKSNRTGFPSKNKKKKISYSILREKVDRKKHIREKSLPSSTIPSVRPMRECKKEKDKDKEKEKEKEKVELKLDGDTKVSEEKLNSLKRTSIKPRGRPPKISRLIEQKNEDLNNEVTQNSLTENLTNILKNRVFNKLEEAGSSTDAINLSLHEPSDNDRDTALPLLMSESNSSEPPSGAEDLETNYATKRKKIIGHGTKEKFKKTFMKAGLFSYDFKMDDQPSSDNESLLKSKQSGIYKAEEHPHSLLPPPYYCGRQLRQKRDDFQLPHDLWWLHMTKQLPVRDVVATWNFKKIKNNIYYDVKPVQVYESPACHCKRPSDENAHGCEYNSCINRMTYTECDMESCPIADRCSNMAIQKHAAIQSLERFMTEDKGWGLRTKTAIKKGTFIMEYVGEVVSDKEFKRRMLREYQHDSHHYCMHIDGGMVIDGHRMGGECRFVNHSCKPNCEMQKWSVNGTYRMALFPKRNIEPNEELTYDYNFSLFNPHEGQICRCASVGCRGIIGGKTQRVQVSIQNNTQSSESRTSQQEKSKDGVARINKVIKKNETNKSQVPQLVTIKPLSLSQQQFCRYHQIFLLRNLEKVRKLREAMLRKDPSGPLQPATKSEESPNVNKVEDMIKTSLTALTTARTTQTRRLVIAQDHPDVAKVAKLAQILQEMLAHLINLKDKKGSFVSRHLQLPSKKTNAIYWQIIEDPIDLNSIERNINSGSYSSIVQFDSDLRLVFQNSLRYYGSLSPQGQAALSMRKRYEHIFNKASATLTEIVGEKELKNITQSEPVVTEQEDIIRCPCGQYKDEGVMVECEQCGVWQHIDCVQPGVDLSKQESYMCEKCGDRPGIHDIPLIPQPEYACPGETYYIALQREDGMKVCLGDTVYVLRAFEEEGKEESETSNTKSEGGKCMEVGGIPHKALNPMKGPSRQAASLSSGNYPTYRTVSTDTSTSDMDIFRVERLWKNEKGDHFAFGHHYLRPHETFHEPSRKFFYNEVFRVPLYEVLPLDTIWRKSWVMDPVTYSRGRPQGAQEEHVYICEYRVDKTARLFNKISKPKYPVCTKSYAFDLFDQKLKVTRSYTPHQVPDKWTRASRPKSEMDVEEGAAPTKKVKKNKPSIDAFYSNSSQRIVKKPIDAILRKLLEIQGDDDPIDATHLLDKDKRQRNKNCIMHSKV